PPVAMDPPPTGNTSDGADHGGTATDSGATGGGPVSRNQEDSRPGTSGPEASPVVSPVREQKVAGTERDAGLLVVAVGSSTLGAAPGAPVLAGGWPTRSPATNRRPTVGATTPLPGRPSRNQTRGPAPAERLIRRPTVVKDEPYRPRHRLGRG